jgi:hypothetical protein
MIGTIDQAALQLRTVAQAAYTQESTYSYDDGADLTLVIADEIIELPMVSPPALRTTCR